jgi:hypothetical protein
LTWFLLNGSYYAKLHEEIVYHLVSLNAERTSVDTLRDCDGAGDVALIHVQYMMLYAKMMVVQQWFLIG